MGERVPEGGRMRSLRSMFRNELGWTYLAALMAVVLMGTSLTVVGTHWKIILQREREAELLFRGLRIKHAIERYAADYEVRKGTRPNQYPLRLDQLVEGPKRYLPKVYQDPITHEDFDLIVENGQIHGVRSRSQEAPLDRVHFKEAETYGQVAFRAISPSSTGQACTGGPTAINPLNQLSADTCAESSGHPE